MTHDEAKKSMVAEAYILDDLEPAERTAFEEHFFDCTDCTADVLDAATVADGIRTENTNVVAFPRHYPRWAAAAAGAAVAIGLAYQYVPQIAGLRHHPSNPPTQAAHATAGEQIIDLDAPRASQAPYIIKGKQPVSVGFVIPVMDPHPPYICELRDETGHVINSKTVSTKEEASNPVTLPIAAGKFHNGKYTLEIRGGDPEIPAYHFAVEVQ
jgi:anti-sigma factor RsiW